MIAAGIGCRRGTPAEEIEALVRQALAAHAPEVATPDVLATAADKAAEAGIGDAARRFGIPLVSFDREMLAARSDAVLTRSPRVEALIGVPAVAEAAALVAAGFGARLLGPRLASARATCALAIGDGPEGDGSARGGS